MASLPIRSPSRSHSSHIILIRSIFRSAAAGVGGANEAYEQELYSDYSNRYGRQSAYSQNQNLVIGLQRINTARLDIYNMNMYSTTNNNKNCRSKMGDSWRNEG